MHALITSYGQHIHAHHGVCSLLFYALFLSCGNQSQVRVNVEERAQRWKVESTSFAYCRSANGPWSNRDGDRFVSKKHRRVSVGWRRRGRLPAETQLGGSLPNQVTSGEGSTASPCTNTGGGEVGVSSHSTAAGCGGNHKRGRPGADGEGVSGGGNRSGDQNPKPPVVDFLAVVSMMRLTELFNEARPGELSPRDTYLKVGARMIRWGYH